MKKLLILSFLFFTTSIYTFKVSSVTGSQIDFNDFRGKKILIVNIASGSRYAGQIGQLEQLHQLYPDNLVIVAFPSNNFGNEPMNNMEIDNFCRSNYKISFLVAEKNDVISDNIQPVYKWLARKSENGIGDTKVKGDFQKYLIDEEGSLLGIFAPSVNPMSNEIKNVIAN